MLREQPLSRDALVAAFYSYAKPREAWRVGTELERHLLRPDGRPVPYHGEHGVRWLLEALAPNGWQVEYEGPVPVALYRDGASVTLEPGAQFELSTAPFAGIAGLDEQSAAFVEEVDAAIGDAPLLQVALGYTPYAAMDEVAWVPKGRYTVMREFLSDTGPLAHDMMKGTCAVQASFDFGSEADCAAKVRLGTLLGPLTTAMYANSPLTRGQPNGYASFRGHVWTLTDPRRTGFPEAAAAFSFERWVDYLLDVPMMFLKGAEGWRPAQGLSFRDWMDNGLDGTHPTASDWDLHLTSVFPEVRVKHYIEVRGADCVPRPLALSLSALFKGLYYDQRALEGALEVVERYASHGNTAERFATACRDGLAGTHGGRRLADWAAEIASCAAGGLERQGLGEVPFLAPLVAQIERGESPSADVLRAHARDPRPEALLDTLRYRV